MEEILIKLIGILLDIQWIQNLMMILVHGMKMMIIENFEFIKKIIRLDFVFMI